MSIRIEALNTSHSSLLPEFRCQHIGLKDYIHNFALMDVQTRLCQTYLALHESTPQTRLAGYFCITIATIDTTSDSAIGFPIPAVYLMRLAIDSRVQGQGLGTYLLTQAIKFGLSNCPNANVMIADAEKDDVIEFYKKNGFQALNQIPGRMALIIGETS